jgi:poly(hydroxyalkanoate) depolymerase family esterase
LKSLRNLYHRFVAQSRPSTDSPARHHVDTRGITQTIKDALAAAGLDTRSGVAKSVTETIEQALSRAGLGAAGSANAPRPPIEGSARDVTTSAGIADEPAPTGPAVSDEPASDEPVSDEPFGPGEFTTHSFSNESGTRVYKLYVPASYSPASHEHVPLVVMLHGCTQDPDDFAAGTRMNSLADEHGFIVAYPAQEARANGSKCWNWFRAQDQARDRGEPSLIAGITREIASRYRVDERRIFVAGLSAGAGMAVVLAATYPELYAAVGVHSGLPYAAAHDVASAFSVMQGGIAARSVPSAHAVTDVGAAAGPGIPAIVFHGDRDATVNAANAEAIVQQACATRAGDGALHCTTTRGTSPHGRGYTRTVLADGARQPVIEHWVLHGAGHAWSGGSARGSFTDPDGPDASAEMIRFFYSQHRGGSA